MSVDSVRCDPLYSVESGLEGPSIHYDEQACLGKTDAVALCERVRRLKALCHLFFYSFRSDQCQKMPSRAREVAKSDSDDFGGSTTNDDEVIKKAVFEKWGRR